MATILIQVAVGIAISAGLSVLSRILTPKPAPIQNEGPRLDELQVSTSTEGQVINQLYGRMRLAGQVIWSTTFREVVTTDTQTSGGGKGGGGGGVTTVTTTYTYFISFAIAFCTGNEKTSLARVWADGKELDMSKYNFRFYPGSDDQDPDPKMEAVQGVGNVPGYRGSAYLVFEDFPISDFGNRIPQISAEISVPLLTDDQDDIQNSAQAFDLIPASGEVVYGQVQYDLKGAPISNGFFGISDGEGGEEPQFVTAAENVHNGFRLPDAVVSMNQLYGMIDNLDAVMLVVAWFGNDLRAGECTVVPKQEGSTRELVPDEWAVESYNRGNAETVTLVDGRPVYGGTPSDTTVTQIIQAIKSQGKRVIFYPFVLMDIASGNSLPNPYSDNAAGVGQGAFPWRGRITCSPAPGYVGTVDKTATAATQINNWFDQTEGYTRMVTHYANLCDSAGGVDGFVIGSELVGLTKSRSALGTYPAVTKLVALAATVKGILGSGCKVGYAADWSEQDHESADGLWFHLDPIWASANVDFVGIDNYMPTSDWRDGGAHLDFDAENGPTSEYDRAYLASQIEGGEYFDYYYADAAARNSQTRTPITDGLGKPWVFRRKDLRSWWSNDHYNRPDFVEDGSPTDWVPYSKPIWFTEFGCPAVNKGTNQPNVFYDPKSSESFFPYSSTGLRDDLIQRLHVETTLAYWRDNTPIEPGNPSNKMVEAANMFIWTWDARPYPDFPARLEVWSDGGLWYFGHWFTGRVDAIVLARLVRYLCLKAGLADEQIDVEGLYGPGAIVRGYVVNGIMTVRDMLQALANSHMFDAFESQGVLKFTLRNNVKQISISDDDFVIDNDDAVGMEITRGQETELPATIKATFIDEYNAYQQASTDGKTSKGYSQNTDTLTLPEVLTEGYVKSLLDSLVQQAWIGRDSGIVRLPPNYLKLDAGDVLTIPDGSRDIDIRLTQIDTTDERKCEFRTFDIGMFTLPPSREQPRTPPVVNIYGQVVLEWVDLPLQFTSQPFKWAPMIAAYADPWPGAVSIYRKLADNTYSFVMNTAKQSRIGELVQDFPAGPYNYMTNRPAKTTGSPQYADPDPDKELIVRLYRGTLESIDMSLLGTTKIAIGIQNQNNGFWEMILFATAELIDTKTYRIRNLIRGIDGTHEHMMDPFPEGARVVILDPNELEPLQVSQSVARNSNIYRWGPAQYTVDDPSYVEGTRYGFNTGLIPLSPVHLRLRWPLGGVPDMKIQWMARTRDPNADDWETQAQLYEAFERYKVTIYNDNTFTTVKRTIIVDGHPAGQDNNGFDLRPETTYTSAMNTADWGSPVTILYVGIAMWGTDYGAYGIEQKATISISNRTTYEPNDDA